MMASQMHKWVMKTIGGRGWEMAAGTEPVESAAAVEP